jgi:glycosyltransferase involved in cell wall biosynthesis
LCGLPAVVSRVGDLPDLVSDGVNGCLVEERSGAAFAGSISALLRDPGRYQAMSHAARQSAQQYEFGKCVQRWDDILDVRSWQWPGQPALEQASDRPVAGRK